MISSAFTKNVPTKGSNSVRYSKCAAIAQIKAAEEIKNITQNIPVFLFCCSMNTDFCNYFCEIRSIASKSHLLS